MLQYASGADLGILFVNVLSQSGIEPSQEYFDKITSLFGAMSPLLPERDTFMQSALRWSIKNTEYKTGHPNLHQKIAQVFWRGKLLRYFLAVANSPALTYIVNLF